MKKILGYLLQFLLFLSIGAVILYLVYRSQNTSFLEDCALRGVPSADCNLLKELATDFKNANFGWIFLVLIAFVLSNFSRAVKWNMLLHPLGYYPRFINSFLAILVGYFANLGLPRMGEVVRAGILAKYENIPAEKVFGTIVVDRIVDVLCLLLAFALALVFEHEKLLALIRDNTGKDSGDEAGGGFPWLLTALAVGLLLFVFFRKKLAQTAVFQRIAKTAVGFKEGMLTVAKLEKPWLFTLHSLNIFFMYFLMTWLGFQAFAPTEHLDLTAALTVFVSGTLGMVIPSPGGMGTFHFLVTESLTKFYGIRGDDAFSVANIIFFTVQISFNIILGVISLVLLRVLNSGASAKKG